MAVFASTAPSQQAKTDTISLSTNVDGFNPDAPSPDEVPQRHCWVCSIERIDCPFAPSRDGRVDRGFVPLRGGGGSRPGGLCRNHAAEELRFWAREHHVDGAVLD